MKLRHGLRIGLACVALFAAAGRVAADVVPVVSARSAVMSLTRSQVADIFLGKTRRFPDGTLALPVDQTEGATARDEFYSRFAAKSPAQVKAHWSKVIFTGPGQPPVAVAGTADLLKRIAANPAAIGYVDRSLIDDSVRVVE